MDDNALDRLTSPRSPNKPISPRSPDQRIHPISPDRKTSPRIGGKFFSYVPLINFSEGSPSISPSSSRSHTPRSRHNSESEDSQLNKASRRSSGQRSNGRRSSGRRSSGHRKSSGHLLSPHRHSHGQRHDMIPIEMPKLPEIPSNNNRAINSLPTVVVNKSTMTYDDNIPIDPYKRRNSAPKHKTHKIIESESIDSNYLRQSRHSHDGSMRHRKKKSPSNAKFNISYQWPDKRSIIYYERSDREYAMFNFSIENDDEMILCIPIEPHTLSTYDLVVKDQYTAITLFYDVENDQIVNIEDETDAFRMINVYSKYWIKQGKQHTYYPIYVKYSSYVCTAEKIVKIYPLIYDHIVMRKLRESRHS